MLMSVLKYILSAYERKNQTLAYSVIYFPSSHLNFNKCFRVAYKTVFFMCSNNIDSVQYDQRYTQNFSVTAD